MAERRFAAKQAADVKNSAFPSAATLKDGATLLRTIEGTWAFRLQGASDGSWFATLVHTSMLIIIITTPFTLQLTNGK